jgi:hypothetical protein
VLLAIRPAVESPPPVAADELPTALRAIEVVGSTAAAYDVLLGGALLSRGLVVTELLRAQCKALKMPGLARGFEPLGRQAREERWSAEDYLHECLSVEQTSRHDSAVRERVRQARFPELKTLDAFDFAAATASTPPSSPTWPAGTGSPSTAT